MEALRGAALAAGLLALALVATACGSTAGGEAESSLTVYSGRKEEFIGPLFDRFQQETGITLDVRYADSAELAATILEEGRTSPADVFVSQDAGSLGAVADAGLLSRIPGGTLLRVDARFRSPRGLWVGISGRARVAAYNTDRVAESDLPDSVLGFTGPEWRSRIGFPPTNGSFQAFVAAMILTEGEDVTRSFFESLAEGDPTLYEDNSSVVRGVAAGEVDVGLVNHYYLYEISAEEGDIPVANHFFTGGDPGALVNTAGAGILASSDRRRAAERLVDFLTGDEGQSYFATESYEYPVVPGHEPGVELVPLEDIEAPRIDLSDLGGALEPALRLLAEVGLV